MRPAASDTTINLSLNQCAVRGGLIKTFRDTMTNARTAGPHLFRGRSALPFSVEFSANGSDYVPRPPREDYFLLDI